MSAKKSNSKYYIFYFISISTVIISIIMSVIVLFYFINYSQKSADVREYDQYYVMIPADRKLAFWQSVYEGAYNQGQQNNIYVELFGENLSVNYSNEELMRMAIASKADGIIVSANEGKEMTELINEATDQGIPVVTVYNDNTKSKRCSFVGVGRYNVGREYGRQVLKIAEAKRKSSIIHNDFTETKLDVMVLVNGYTEDSEQNIVYSGISETIEKEKPDATVINLSLVSIEDKNSFSVEESIRDIFMEEDLPDIIICQNELNTTCVYQAVVDYNKVGVVDILGYYDSDTILNAISREVMYATVNVDTTQMGEYCVDALSEYHNIGTTSQYFTADITLINRFNVDRFLEEPAE